MREKDFCITVRDAVTIKANDEDDLKAAVAEVGPISVSMNARRGDFKQYKTGKSTLEIM